MTAPVLPHDLSGRFLGVGSLKEEREGEALEYVLKLALPYVYQRPEKPEEDMIRQFGVILQGFEDKGTFIYDAEYDIFQQIIREEDPLLPPSEHFATLYEIQDKGPFHFLKTQVTAPATMCYSIRDESGQQHLTPQMFRFFSSLISRIMKGYATHFANTANSLIICQDDPAFGFVMDAIKAGNAPGLSGSHIMKTIDDIFPANSIPAYHYCYDWRDLYAGDKHLLWNSRPKIAHIDVINYPPVIDIEQSEQINAFLEKGGALALGAIANTDAAYSERVLEFAKRSIHVTIGQFVEAGVLPDLLEGRTMISTQCGLSGASPKLSREIHAYDADYPKLLEDSIRQFR